MKVTASRFPWKFSGILVAQEARINVTRVRFRFDLLVERFTSVGL
jgi:hypothetical protein